MKVTDDVKVEAHNEEWIALVFSRDIECLGLVGPYSDYYSAMFWSMEEFEESYLSVPIKIEDYFEGMEDYLIDSMKQLLGEKYFLEEAEKWAASCEE